MLAAVALLLPSHPAVAGIIADSSYARLDEMIHLLILQILAEKTVQWPGFARLIRPLLPAVTRLMVLGGRLLFQVRYRHPPIARPDRVIGRQTQCPSGTISPPILLIHAEHDPLISLHHAHRLFALARAAGCVIHTYYTPCAIHCGSYGYDPQRYIALLQAFVALEREAGTSDFLGV